MHGLVARSVRLSSRLLVCASAAHNRSLINVQRSTMSLKHIGQAEATAIDQELFNDYGFSVDQLMELAGLSCAQALHSVYKQGSVLILAGPGNNGGDSLVAARHLKLFGFEPTILYPKESQNELMKRLVKQVTLMGIKFIDELPSDLSTHFQVIVDGFFGFSFKPPVREPFGEILSKIIKSKVPVFSIDIPSGWDVEKGPINDVPNLAPDSLISLTAPKKCAKHFKGRNHFLGGRFVPQKLANEHSLNLPTYPDAQQFTHFDDDKLRS